MVGDRKSKSIEYATAEKLVGVELSSTCAWNKWDWWLVCAILAFGVGACAYINGRPTLWAKMCFMAMPRGLCCHMDSMA